MSIFRTIFILFLVLTSIPSLLYAWEGKVLEVPEGDIINVLKDGQEIQIRLASIDCPEKGMPYALESRELTLSLVRNKTIRVWPAKSNSSDRTTAFVFIEKKNLNKELLSAGLAWHYKKYSRDPELAKLEFKARKKKLGLWSQPNPIPPWEYQAKKHLKPKKINFGMDGDFCQGTQKNR